MSDTPRTSVNQAPGGGTDYPFVAPCDLEGTVLDFYVSYADPGCGFRLPFSLTVAGNAVTVSDADDVTVATLDRTQGASKAWGSREVREWVSGSTVVRSVTSTWVDGTGVLDPRTCQRLPARVTSLTSGIHTLTGALKFSGGYNMTVTATAAETRVDGGRLVTKIVFDATPGTGLGRVSGCDADVVVRTINGVPAGCGGNFTTDLGDCFRGQVPVTYSGSGAGRTASFSHAGLSSFEAAAALKLFSDCKTCDDCDYYARTYTGLSRVWSRWRGLAVAAEGVRDTYKDNRQRWMAARDCRITNPSRLVVSAQKACKTFVGGSFCNVTGCCLTNVELRFTLATAAGPWDGDVSPTPEFDYGQRGSKAYAPQQVGNVVRFFADTVEPDAMLVAKMKLCTPGCKDLSALTGTLTVHATSPDGECEFHAVSLPTDLTDQWAGQGFGDAPALANMSATAPLDSDDPEFPCRCDDPRADGEGGKC